jgi:hypothetical protein
MRTVLGACLCKHIAFEYRNAKSVARILKELRVFVCGGVVLGFAPVQILEAALDARYSFLQGRDFIVDTARDTRVQQSGA